MSWRKPDPVEEVDYMLRLYSGKDGIAECLHIISNQFSVLQTRSQLLLTLATIVLTITGFSGPRIAASGLFARGAMSIGLVLTLIAVVTLLANLRIRWLTQFKEATDRDTLIAILRYREGKRKAYLSIITLLIAGLGCYVAAVVAFLITGEAVAHY